MFKNVHLEMYNASVWHPQIVKILICWGYINYKTRINTVTPEMVSKFKIEKAYDKK